MKTLHFTSILLGACFGVLLALLACNLDNGLEFENPGEDISEGIRGQITFVGDWPQNIAEARLVVSADFPPDPADPLQSFIFSDPIRIGVAAVDYGLALRPDTYEIIAVIFRETAQPWDISNILAVHKPLNPCTIIPDLDEAVTVDSQTVLNGVDLSVDLTKGSFNGTVRFEGEWSDEIGFAGVVAFEHPLNFADLIPCGLAILPLNVDEADYRVLVPANDYSLLVVAGRNLADLVDLTSIADLRILGTYFDPDRGSQAGVINVMSNQNTPNIDVVANLDLF